jgi:hypothetical protein
VLHGLNLPGKALAWLRHFCSSRNGAPSIPTSAQLTDIEMGQLQLGEKKGTGPMPEKGKEKEKDQVEL